MMPSRGLHLARGNAPRLYQLQCRNLSSASRRIPQTTSRNALSSHNPPAQLRRAIPAFTTSIQATRNASTNAPPTPPPASTPEPPVYPDMDTITLDNIDLSSPDIPAHIASIPEKIGYLHEIGLNYGWGPTSILEWTIEHFHISAGLPWWASIAATAVALRVALIPFFIKSSDVMARQGALVSVTKPITERMQESKRINDQQGMLQAWAELRAVRKRAGVSFRTQFTPMILQGVFGYCGFKLLRAASNLPVPAFKTEGPLWLGDLTVPDPYLILPVVMAGCIHLLIRMGGETGSAQMPSPGMQKFMLYGMPGIIILGTGYQSAAVCVWFAAGGALGIVQSLTLQRPAVRKWLGIAPLYKPTAEERDQGPLAAWMGTPSGDTSRPTTTRPGSGGKNAAYMNPTYQSPNLRSSSSARNSQVIDVKAVPPRSNAASASTYESDDMISPSGPAQSSAKSSGGVFKQASSAFKDFSKAATERRDAFFRNTPEGRAQKEKEARRRAEKDYETKAREREREKERERRKRGGR
ncbi:uncharacterized protein LTR77_009730 [Saxophila tyrrhenica]|uniref:Membrane insertase YidC/Oxa/ALB C-terminal domain-containing protein n=1 Tax=Saxophila tyrrhenica TaxID=1690608 RepID=A0AAV9NYW5_9PEZI|nr:hypothetical protein LTR77_009730 [Saxophila tyrrhenica]